MSSALSQPPCQHHPPHLGPHPKGSRNYDHPITVYAHKFGAKSSGHVKSWLTPLDPLFPLNWENKRHDDRIKLLGNYQKDELFHFTTRELKDLDAVCDRPLRESTLAGGIIPLLRRDRWEDEPSTAWLRKESIPIRNDPLGGRWQSSNDRVWNVLKPIVILASQYLSSSQSLPWFDALLLGPRRFVVEDRYPPGSKIQKEYHTFHPRDGPWTVARENEVSAERDRIFDGLMYQMDYMFSYTYSHQNARDNDPPDDDPSFPCKSFGTSLGVTTINTWEMIVRRVPNAKWRVQTFINVGALEAFLFQPENLSGSERAAMIFRTATTIAHEVMHAIGYYQALQRLGPRLLTNVREGYFEHEQMAELGWSWQWAIHGGIDAKKPNNYRSRRILASFSERNFPSFTTKSFAATNQPILLDPPIHNYGDFYPIGVQFYEDIQNQDFWDLMIRGFGGRIFQYRTVKEGTRVTYERGAVGAPFTVLRRDRLDPVLHDPYQAEDAFLSTSMMDIKSQVTHTPSERKLMAFVTELADSAKMGKVFWERMAAQLVNVREILEILIRSHENDESGVDKDWGLLTTAVREVVELLVVAATNHEKLVGLLLEKQRKLDAGNAGGIAGSSEDVAARRALLAWNRGTRGFNREILEKFGKRFKNGELGRKLNVSYNLLEKCQALLFSPRSKKGDVSKYPQDQNEFDLLTETAVAIHTEKNYAKGNQMCSRLVSDKYIGSFVKSGANLMVASCEVEKAGGVEKMPLAARHKCCLLAERGLERLIWLRGEINQITEGWDVLFDEYIEWGRKLLAFLRVEARELLPGAIEQMEGSTEAKSRTERGTRKMEGRKRTREQVEEMAFEVIDDLMLSDPETWEGLERLRPFKKLRLDTESPGDRAPE